MADYPQTLSQLEAMCSTEEACREYLAGLRWPQGFVCPRCGHRREAWRTRRGLWVCRECGHQTSATAGTIFQDTHKPLTMWFRAIWSVTSQKTGASALGVQRALGLGSYKTAWAWLQKFRRAMVRPGRDRLSGRVEVDETFLGAAQEGVSGRQPSKKALVVIGAQEDGRGIGRIRMRRIPDASALSLRGFLVEAIQPGSTVHTDGWEGYKGLATRGYVHQVTLLKGRAESALELLPRVHRVVSLLNRWLMGTHHGAVSPAHLDYYLDEFTFRFNRRTSHHRGKLFYRLLQNAVAIDPAPYGSLVRGVRGRSPRAYNR